MGKPKLVSRDTYTYPDTSAEASCHREVIVGSTQDIGLSPRQ